MGEQQLIQVNIEWKLRIQNSNIIYSYLKMSSITDLEYAILNYTKTFQQYRNEKISLQSFSDGLIFASMLRCATNFNIKYGDLNENCHKWTFRLSNLKKLVAMIQDYFEQQVKKGIKTKDIDLIEISKNNNIDQTLKLYEIVIAALTEAPNKSDHITTIMSLDQRSQAAFVNIIQNLLETRILDKNETNKDRVSQTINHLQMENTLLRSQVQSLLNQNFQLDKQVQQLKARNIDYQEQLTKLRDQELDKVTHKNENEQFPKQKQHLKNMISNLKQKLIATVRQSEIKIATLKQQIHGLQQKCMKYEQLQQELLQNKKKYIQMSESYGKMKVFEKQKARLLRTIDQKQDTIKKLTTRLDQANQLNFAMQQRQVYSKMELQKRDVRFKQLEKQVRKKYSANNAASMDNVSSTKSLQLLGKSILSQQINQADKQQIEQLKTQIEALKKKNRQNQRQNNRLRRNQQKTTVLQNDKKKLQRLITDICNQKKQQIELLLSTTYDFYAQIQRLRTMLSQKGIQV